MRHVGEKLRFVAIRRLDPGIKYKINSSQEFVIGGYTPGNPLDALIVGYYESGKLYYAAKVRNGFVRHLRREVSERLKGLETADCPFANLPEKKRTQWALTEGRDEKLPVAPAPGGRTGRIYRVDAGRSPESCQFRRAERR